MGLRRHFLIQVGFALIDVRTGTVVARFSSYVAQPPGTGWEQRCVDEFWSKHPEQWERAKKGIETAPSVDEVAADIKTWIRENVTQPANTRLVVNTPGFDCAWLDWLLGDVSHLYLLGAYSDVLEVSSWYLGLARVCDPDASSKKASLAALGETEEPVFAVEHDHDAANDAAATALRAAWVMRRVQAMRAC